MAEPTPPDTADPPAPDPTLPDTRITADPLFADVPPTRVRFGVLGFMCSLSLLTYLDRICIAQVSDRISADLGLSEVQMGFVFGAFAVGYCLFEVPGGWMGDAWGPRRVITRIVLWWSLFTALTGSVGLFSVMFDSFVLLMVVRFLFGCGEAGAYPNLTRITGSWFPYRERGLTQGAVWMSARLGGAVAPVVIVALAELVSWRGAFFALGLIGLTWSVLFWPWFRDTPEEHPRCNDAERKLIRSGPGSFQADEAGRVHAAPPWARILLSPNIWALGLASFGVSFGWYFYTSWQPKFLRDVHGISFKDSPVITGLPFLFGAAGSLIGGRLSDWLVFRTGSRRWGRSLVGFVGFGVAGCCILATGMVAQPWQAVALLCFAFFINDLAIPPIWAVSADIGGRFAGTVSGVMNMCGAAGAVLSPILIPVMLRLEIGWPTIFAMLACAWFIAALAWLRIDATERIEGPEDRLRE